MSIASRGATMGVDWEQRIDFARLRQDRLEEGKAGPRGLGPRRTPVLDPNNIRYITSTHIGEWSRDKNARFVLLPRGADPVLWDFGSAAKHHQIYAPWFPPENFRGGVSPMRGAMPHGDRSSRRDGGADRRGAPRARARGRASRVGHPRHGRPTGADAGRRAAHRRDTGHPFCP